MTRVPEASSKGQYAASPLSHRPFKQRAPMAVQSVLDRKPVPVSLQSSARFPSQLRSFGGQTVVPSAPPLPASSPALPLVPPLGLPPVPPLGLPPFASVPPAS